MEIPPSTIATYDNSSPERKDVAEETGDLPTASVTAVAFVSYKATAHIVS